jgi:hypothetical protein
MARSAFRRLERFSLGIVFGVVAWIVERRVLKSIRKKGLTPPAKSAIGDHATSELERPSG